MEIMSIASIQFFHRCSPHFHNLNKAKMDLHDYKHYINSDKLIKYIFDILGVPGTLLNDDVSVSQKREQDAMVQQQQLQQQQLAQSAEAAGKAAPAVKEVANMMATEAT